MKAFSCSRWFHLRLLLIWMAVGAGLRFFHLSLKPLWTDEFATLVFSLGHSFKSIPLNQVISSQVLLQPLAPTPPAGVGAVVHNLLTESNHPPLYFVLTHWWLQLFPLEQADTLVWAARALSALFGVLTIPAVFGLGWLAFRSALVGQLCAALMAVSPFGIYLAQEARHYTLPILWGIASLGCLVIATRRIEQQRKLPLGVGLLWVLVNSLGIATHYFFAFGLMAQGLVLLGQGLKQSLRNSTALLERYWWRVYGVAAGTLAAGLVWVPVWNNTYGSELTQWIYRSDRLGFEWLEPIYLTLAWLITMVSMLPIQAPALPVVILSGLIMLTFVGWALPILIRGLRAQTQRLEIQGLVGFVLGAIAIFWGLTYILHADVTSAARYSFVYFPALIVLIGAALAYWWQREAMTGTGWRSHKLQDGRKIVLIFGLMGVLSTLSVASDLAYQKTHRPELLAQTIQQTSRAPVLIAIAHKTHGQTGRLMGLAWEFEHRDPQNRLAYPPQFLLAHQDAAQTPAMVLEQSLVTLPRPLDLWLVNFPEINLSQTTQCTTAQEAAGKGWVDGYDYQLYHCSSRS